MGTRRVGTDCKVTKEVLQRAKWLLGHRGSGSFVTHLVWHLVLCQMLTQHRF